VTPSEAAELAAMPPRELCDRVLDAVDMGDSAEASLLMTEVTRRLHDLGLSP